MRRLRFQSLGIAVTAGAAAALWTGIVPTVSWLASRPTLAAVLGMAGVGLLVGVLHHAWTRPSRRRWQELHDRQSRLDVSQQGLACKVKLLELERQRLETIFNALSDAVLVTAADDTVQLANRAAERLLHLPADRSTPCPVEQVIEDPRLLQLIRETRDDAAGPVCRHMEHRVRRDDASMIFNLTLAGLEKTDAPRSADEPDAGGVLVILRDVTQQRCVAERHSDFVSSVSHELRTPLSSIKAYMEMLVDGEAQDEPTRQEFYAIVQAETNRLTRLIDNVLNISQIESGLADVQSTLVDLHELVRQAMEQIGPQARTAGVELDGPADEGRCEVIADGDMLLQAMLNLLGNAVKYTRRGGRVSVTLRELPQADGVEVSVSDTGLGIPEADVPFLFDKFYRVASHRQLVKGTGLGLNLVKHVVETVHGGTLTVASRPGEGSTFTFRLSMVDKGKGETDAAGAAGDVRSTPTEREVTPCVSETAAGKDEK